MPHASDDLMRVIDQILNTEALLSEESDPMRVEELKNLLEGLYNEFYALADGVDPWEFGLKGRPS